jgi:hypothetical protein
MILLDTDHVSSLKFPESERGARLAAKLDALSASEDVGVTVITIEELMRGWLSSIARRLSLHQAFSMATPGLANCAEFILSIEWRSQSDGSRGSALASAEERQRTCDHSFSPAP